MPGPILREYWTGNRAFWLVDFSYWPSDCLSRVIKTKITPHSFPNKHDLKDKAYRLNYYGNIHANVKILLIQRRLTKISFLMHSSHSPPDALVYSIHQNTGQVCTLFEYKTGKSLGQNLPRLCHICTISKPITCLMSPYLQKQKQSYQI